MKFTDKIKEAFSNNKAEKSQKEEKIETVEQKLTLKQEAIDFFKDLVVILIIVIFIRSFIMVPFQISGHSMNDSFYDREYIIVDKLSYLDIPFFGRLSDPKRWDVVVFRPWVSDDKKFFIKRIIATEWETLKLEQWKVYIKKVWSEEFETLDEKYLNWFNNGATFVSGNWDEKLYVVPENSYFVMWDNRNGSTDSRECFYSCTSPLLDGTKRTNFIKKKDIEWIVFLDLWYFNLKKFGWKNDGGKSTFPKFFNIPRQFDYNKTSKR